MGFYDAYAPSFQQKSSAPVAATAPATSGSRVQFGLAGHPTIAAGYASPPTRSVSGVGLTGGGSANGGTSFGDFSGGVINKRYTTGDTPAPAPPPTAQVAPPAPVAPPPAAAPVEAPKGHASYNDVNNASQQSANTTDMYASKQEQAQRAAKFNAGATGADPWPTTAPPAQGGFYQSPTPPNGGIANTVTGVDTGNYSYGNGQRSF